MKREPKEQQCANKNCDRIFMQYKSTVKVCSVGCAVAFAREKKFQRELKRARKEKKEWNAKNETVQKLADVAQVPFNTFVRQRDAGKPCISCGAKLVGKFDAGHYHNSNNHWNVRYDLRNVHGQCVKCNRDEHGNLINYRIGLEQRIGLAALVELDSIANITRKFTREELSEVQKYWKSKIN